MKNKKYIIGIDGGGSKTHAVLFDDEGKTLNEITDLGSSLSIYKKQGVKVILNVLKKITRISDINLENIDAVGIGIAGISDENHRDILLNELDRLNISKNSLVLSDLESAFELLCPGGVGVIACIGTGIICYGKNRNERSLKIAGNGHDKGDCGSAFWIGKRSIKHILVNQSIVNVDKELIQINNAVKNKLNIESIKYLNNVIEDGDNMVCNISSIAPEIIKLAQEGNDLALSVIQEATTYVSEYLITLFNELNINKDGVLISGHGSVVKNNFYRKLLNEALQFDLKKIKWIFSDLSSAYGAGILASKFKGINISIDEIVENLRN
tara:strand:- start:567 stop:1541 length:975 start_codon:yes stop_codon:yes gene_type:complete